MTYLFILDSVEAPQAINPQLGRRLAAELAALGHSVHLLELWDGETPPPAVQGLTLHDLPFPDERLMNAALENGVKQGTPVPLRLLRLLAHPTGVAAAFRQLVLHRPRRVVDTRRELERLDSEFHFDAVCAVCAPYRAAFALETARIQAKKYLWQMDPYAANRTYTAPGGYGRESALLRQMDGSFIMPEAQPEYAPGAPLAAFAEKVHVLGLPCLIPADSSSAPHEGLRCTFCGTLYPELREPDFALSLFTALDRPDLTLTLAGPGWQYFAPQKQAAQAVLQQRLVLPGRVPMAEGRRLQAEADVLVSLGNGMDNQIPSKIFEYCGTGKPVLHLAVSRSDPALPYLARYPLALVLQKDEGCSPEVVLRLNDWLDTVQGKHLPYQEVAALFREFTPQQVALDFAAVCAEKGITP